MLFPARCRGEVSGHDRRAAGVAGRVVPLRQPRCRHICGFRAADRGALVQIGAAPPANSARRSARRHHCTYRRRPALHSARPVRDGVLSFPFPRRHARRSDPGRVDRLAAPRCHSGRLLGRDPRGAARLRRHPPRDHLLLLRNIILRLL